MEPNMESHSSRLVFFGLYLIQIQRQKQMRMHLTSPPEPIFFCRISLAKDMTIILRPHKGKWDRCACVRESSPLNISHKCTRSSCWLNAKHYLLWIDDGGGFSLFVFWHLNFKLSSLVVFIRSERKSIEMISMRSVCFHCFVMFFTSFFFMVNEIVIYSSGGENFRSKKSSMENGEQSIFGQY